MTTKSKGNDGSGDAQWYMGDGKTLRRDYWKAYFVNNNTNLVALSSDQGGNEDPYAPTYGTIKAWSAKYKWKQAKEERLEALANEPTLIQNLSQQLEQVRLAFREPLDVADPRAAAYPTDATHYSDGLYEKLKPYYIASLQDPQQLSLKRDVATADMILAELSERLNTGFSVENWEALRNSYFDLKEALDRLQDGDMSAGVTIQTCIRNMGRVFADGTDASTLSQMLRWQEHRRKLVHSEMMRAKQAADYLNTNDAGQLIARRMSVILDVVKRYNDPELSKEVALALSQASQNDPFVQRRPKRTGTPYPMNPPDDNKRF